MKGGKGIDSDQDLASSERMLSPKDVNVEMAEKKRTSQIRDKEGENFSDDSSGSGNGDDDSEKEQRAMRTSANQEMRGTQGFAHRVRESHV